MSSQQNIDKKIQEFPIVVKSFSDNDSKALKEHFEVERELYRKHFKILEDGLMKKITENWTGFRVNGSWSSTIEKIAMKDFDETLEKVGIVFTKTFDPDDEYEPGKYFCRPSYSYILS